MALTWNQVNAITNKKFIPKMYDGIFLGNPELNRAKSKGWYKKVSGGTSIMIPLEYAINAAGGAYTGTETLDTTDNEVFTAAEYDWKQYYVNITISRRDELKNSGDSQIINFVKAKIKNAEKTQRQNLTTGFWSAGTNAKDLVGIRVHLSTSNSPGGISQSTNSWWAANVDSSTTTLTIPTMQTAYHDCVEDNEEPTVIFGTRANYNRFYGLLQPQQRFVDTETAKAGFSSLMFNGKPFIPTSNAPANYILFLNENHIHWMAHEDEDNRFEDFIKPTNQNAKTGKIYWMGILGSSNNRYHGAMTAVTA